MNFSKIKRILYCIALIKLALMSFACQEIKQHEDLFFLDKAKSNKTYQTQEENDEAKQYKKDMQEIQDLIQKRDLTGLLELKDAIAERWRTKVEIYSPLTSDICKALNSYDFKDNKQYLFARQCAEQVLKNSDEISVDLEKDMVGLLQETEEYRLEVAPQTDWKKDRNERVKFLLHLWNRLEENIDRNFDFNDIQNRPVGNVCVPAPNYMCGIRPEDVKEPEIRAKYITAIEANTAKAKKFNLQLQLHRLDKRMSDFVDQFLIGMYTQLPLDLNELEKNLHLFGIEGKRKEKILKAVNERPQK